MGVHRGLCPGQGVQGSCCCRVPGPEISNLRGDDPFSLVFLEFLQEKGYTKGPFTFPGGVLPLQSLYTGLVLPRGAKPVRPQPNEYFMNPKPAISLLFTAFKRQEFYCEGVQIVD